MIFFEEMTWTFYFYRLILEFVEIFQVTFDFDESFLNPESYK